MISEGCHNQYPKKVLCTHITIGAHITISGLPLNPSIDHTTPDAIKTITANADSDLQSYERRKLGRVNKHQPSTSIITSGDRRPAHW